MRHAFGIDVSEHQGVINWEEVRNSGVEFALIRCGYGMDLENQDDVQFARNVSECTRLKIPFGVYLYSYADSIEKAESEAQHTLRLLKGLKPEYPIYLDMEEARIRNVGKDQILAQTKRYVEILEEAGYWVGIYTYLSWWNTYLTDPWYDTKSKWIAHWGVFECGYEKDYGIWQYTDKEKVNGISKRVDADYSYYDYPKLIKSTGKNGFTKTEPEPEEPEPEAPVVEQKYYIVKEGDTLSEIAEKYNTTYMILAEYNGISNPNLIYVGQRINIPSSEDTNTNELQVGDRISIQMGAPVYGKSYEFDSWVYFRSDFYVLEISGDRVVFSDSKTSKYATGAVDIKYVKKEGK